MIAQDTARGLQRSVERLFILLMGVFAFAYFGPGFWGLLVAAYFIWQGVKAQRRDAADERAELIAMRAGYMSQKLMLGTGFAMILVFKYLPEYRYLPYFAVLFVGVFSEAGFLKLLGAEDLYPTPKWQWWVLGGLVLFFVVAIVKMWRY